MPVAADNAISFVGRGAFQDPVVIGILFENVLVALVRLNDASDAFRLTRTACSGETPNLSRSF